jgi:hypothetical protein
MRMTAAFAAAAAVAVVSIIVLVLTTRQGRARLAVEKGRAETLEKELAEANAACDNAVNERQQALSEYRTVSGERQQAEERAIEAEEARLDALERAERAERSLAARGDEEGVDGALLALERLRVEREWGEVTGTAEPLPQPWDGSMRAAVAAELEIVREVIGVPTRVEAGHTSDQPPPQATGSAARLTAELLRSLARVGEELAVSFGPDGVLIIRVATMRTGPEPDLRAFAAVAAALGGELSVQAVTDGFETRLRLPLPSHR